jgi:hypothetical protein
MFVLLSEAANQEVCSTGQSTIWHLHHAWELPGYDSKTAPELVCLRGRTLFRKLRKTVPLGSAAHAAHCEGEMEPFRTERDLRQQGRISS